MTEKRPVIVRSDDGSLELVDIDRDLRYIFADIDIQNNEYTLWSEDGGALDLKSDGKGTVTITVGSHSANLDEALIKYAEHLEIADTVRELLGAGVRRSIVVDYMRRVAVTRKRKWGRWMDRLS